MPEEGIKPLSDSDDGRPCMATGCDWPGRFIVGIDGGTTTCWCVQHISGHGVAWLRDFADGVIGCLPPGLIRESESG